MISYPKQKTQRNKSLLQKMINDDDISVGGRIFIGGHPCTCVHIDKNDYFFSFDEIFVKSDYNHIIDILIEIYNTGSYNNIIFFDENTLIDIDYLFIPDICQLFGTDERKNKNEYFAWYKLYGNLARIKGRHESNTPAASYWAADSDTVGEANIVSNLGDCRYENTTELMGVPVFFKMHKEV
jgi:hypothetical protein